MSDYFTPISITPSVAEKDSKPELPASREIIDLTGEDDGEYIYGGHTVDEESWEGAGGGNFVDLTHDAGEEGNP